jgi:hypothetical protein
LVRIELGLDDLNGLGKNSRAQMVRFNRIIHGRASRAIETRPSCMRRIDDTVILMDVQMRGPHRFETDVAFQKQEA